MVYTVEFLKNHAVMIDTRDQTCTCEGCNGKRASNYYQHDKDDNSDYMYIDTVKTSVQIVKMNLTINDDILNPENRKNNEFYR